MKNADIELIKRLYLEEKLSASSVARQIGCSLWTVYGTMKKYNIPRRAKSTSNRLTFEATSLSFSPKDSLTPEEKTLKDVSLMLYWAEGSKRGKGTVDFANSDPEMVAIFTECLRRVYGVSEQRLRVLLYCHANQSVEQLQSFWSSLTGIPLSQFTKPYVRQDILTKHQAMPYGLVHIRYSDQRLFKLILSDIRKVIETLPGWWSGQSQLTVSNCSLPSKDGLQSGRIAGNLSLKR